HFRDVVSAVTPRGSGAKTVGEPRAPTFEWGSAPRTSERIPAGRGTPAIAPRAGIPPAPTACDVEARAALPADEEARQQVLRPSPVLGGAPDLPARRRVARDALLHGLPELLGDHAPLFAMLRDPLPLGTHDAPPLAPSRGPSTTRSCSRSARPHSACSAA